MANKDFDSFPLSKTRIYKIYQGMKQRCYNSQNSNFPHYGARGITICPEWLGENGLQNFITWSLENGYNDDLTIDRIDNNGDYRPDNCQWITRSFNSSKSDSNYEELIEYGMTHAHSASKNITSDDFSNASIKQIVKYHLAMSGMTFTKLIEEYNKSNEHTTVSNINNKLSRDTIKYSEIVKLADVMGYDIKWVKRDI